MQQTYILLHGPPCFPFPVFVPLRRQEKAKSEVCSGEHGLLQQPCLLWNAHHHIQILDGLPRCSLHQVIDNCVKNISVSSHFGYTSEVLLSMTIASGDLFGSCIRMTLVIGLQAHAPSQTYTSQSMQQHPASSGGCLDHTPEMMMALPERRSGKTEMRL